MDALGFIDCCDNRGEILFPWIREIVLEKNPDDVLDFGCGDARFSLQLAPHIRGRVAAYDRDPHMREQARRRIAAEGNVRVSLCEQPEVDWEGKFDVIFMLGVWMCWKTHAECVETLGLLAGSLKPNGILIASVTHPSFRDRAFATYHTDFSASHYMANGTPFRVFVGKRGQEVEIDDTHWNLEAMISQVRQAGLMLTDLKEHADGRSGEMPSWLSLVLSTQGR